jgi:hypothetical protein
MVSIDAVLKFNSMVNVLAAIAIIISSVYMYTEPHMFIHPLMWLMSMTWFLYGDQIIFAMYREMM